ncbi:MAG: hypothetical protein AB7S39_23840 [Gemmatimonadales bacterium]
MSSRRLLPPPSLPIRRCGGRLAAAGVLATLLAGPLAAQRIQWMAGAVPVVHWVDRTPDAASRTEASLVRPVAMATAGLGAGFRVRGTVNLEGLSMPDGELWLGGWGEGFVDRRHPHTYLHELIVEGTWSLGCRGGCAVAVFGGKGFAPFGSADPMTRPLLRFPVNHHLAQILERAVAGVQVAIGPALLEAALFNGDEPERPGQFPRIGGRFGDSWAARLTVRPARGLAVAASAATVKSPEHRPGAGAVQHKVHLGLTFDRPFAGGRAVGLLEWARTSELEGTFVFRSALAEAEWRRRGIGLQYRFERTERPEEERLSSFRSARPHLENSILGETRWTTHSVALSVAGPRGFGVAAAPFAEATVGRIAAIGTGAAFDLVGTYGATSFLGLSLGVRLTAGTAEHRMGRYGLAGAAAASSPHGSH